VPTYALYPADPQAPAVLLPEVLTPGIIFSALDGIKAGIKPGLKTDHAQAGTGL